MLRSQKQLSNVFYFFTGLGIFGEFLGQWPIAGASILIYFAIGVSLTKRQKNTEKFADSLYYMGFILTIWALIIAIGPWSGKSMDRLSSSGVIVQFGIALITTALGMTLRIFLLQGRQTVSDQEEDARESIARLVEDMTNEIDTSVKLLASSRTRILAETHELSSRMAADLLAANNETYKRLSTANDEFLGSIRSHLESIGPAVTEIRRRLEAIDLPHDIIRGRIDSAVAEIAADLDRMRATLQQSSGVLATTFDGGVATLNAGMASLATISTDLDRIKMIIGDASDAVARTTAISHSSVAASIEVARETSESSRRFAADAIEASEAVRGIRRTADDMSAAIIKLKLAMDSELTQHHQVIESDAVRLRESVHNAASDIQSFKQTMTESIGFLRDMLEDQPDHDVTIVSNPGAVSP